MASFILKDLVTNDGIDRLRNGNQQRRLCVLVGAENILKTRILLIIMLLILTVLTLERALKLFYRR